MTEFAVLEDGAFYCQKAFCGSQVEVGGLDKPEILLTGCVKTLFNNEKAWEEAMIKNDEINKCRETMLPQIDYDVTTLNNNTTNPKKDYNNYSPMRKLQDNGTDWKILPKTGSRIATRFLTGTAVNPEELLFYHPNSNWFLEGLGYSHFETTLTNEKSVSFEDDKTNWPYRGLLKKRKELGKIDEERRVYYELDLKRIVYTFQEIYTGTTYNELEPLNSQIIIFIASKEKLKFNLSVKDFSILLDGELYREPYFANIRYIEKDDGYYYAVEYTPGWRRYLQFKGTYCYHELQRDFKLCFRSETGFDFPISLCVECADISWWEPYYEIDFIRNLKQETIQTDNLGRILYYEQGQNPGVDFEGNAKITYTQHGVEKTDIYRVKLLSNRSWIRLLDSAQIWEQDQIAKQIELKTDPWTGQSIW